MKSETTESEVVEEAPAVKPRLPLVVILAMVLGALLVLSVGAVIFHVQSSNALKGEVLALKNELKEKAVAHEYMKNQLEQLFGQVELLKENAVASSSSAAGGVAKVDCAAQEQNATDGDAKQSASQEKAVQPEPVPPPRTKKPKSDKPNCELVGKSKEEQEETLKRCISLIDLPK